MNKLISEDEIKTEDEDAPSFIISDKCLPPEHQTPWIEKESKKPREIEMDLLMHEVKEENEIKIEEEDVLPSVFMNNSLASCQQGPSWKEGRSEARVMGENGRQNILSSLAGGDSQPPQNSAKRVPVLGLAREEETSDLSDSACASYSHRDAYAIKDDPVSDDEYYTKEGATTDPLAKTLAPECSPQPLKKQKVILRAKEDLTAYKPDMMKISSGNSKTQGSTTRKIILVNTSKLSKGIKILTVPSVAAPKDHGKHTTTSDAANMPSSVPNVHNDASLKMNQQKHTANSVVQDTLRKHAPIHNISIGNREDVVAASTIAVQTEPKQNTASTADEWYGKMYAMEKKKYELKFQLLEQKKKLLETEIELFNVKQASEKETKMQYELLKDMLEK